MKARFWILIVFVFLLVSAAVFCGVEARVGTMENGLGGPVFVIDPGHGGEDGGAVSEDGARESEINLAICRRTEQMLGLFGCPCIMTRESENLEYPAGATTVRKRKQADLERRVKLVNGTPNAVLLSVHQNKYTSQGPRGAQVFYRDESNSILLAELVQKMLTSGLGESVRAPAVIADSIYLMRKAECPAVLVECGFLSNPSELSLLRTGEYQTRLALCLACACAHYANEWEKDYGQGSKG